MGRVALAAVLTFVIMFVVPFPVYATLAAVAGLELPEADAPGLFVLHVIVTKIGLAIAFVGLLHLARDSWAGRWRTYALVWWVMFAVMEIGQAILPSYSWLEAGGGIVAEAIYCPASAYVSARLLTGRTAPPSGP